MSDLTIHTYTAAEAGLNVNSYLVETGEGVAVVDTNLLNSDIAALVARVDALKQPLVGVFVTHAHPDHFNGVHALVRGRENVPVFATAEVARVIGEIADAKRDQWGPVYGDEWPASTTVPTVRLADAEQVVLGGVRFTARDLGPAESHADSLFVAEPVDGGGSTAFIGDLAFHGVHSYTADGHSGQWLEVLDTIAPDLARAGRLLPGHGAPGGLELITAQRRYLLFYREVVARLAEGRTTLDEAAKTELARLMRAFSPSAPLTWMIGLGADAVAAELAQNPAWIGSSR